MNQHQPSHHVNVARKVLGAVLKCPQTIAQDKSLADVSMSAAQRCCILIFPRATWARGNWAVKVFVPAERLRIWEKSAEKLRTNRYTIIML